MEHTHQHHKPSSLSNTLGSAQVLLQLCLLHGVDACICLAALGLGYSRESVKSTNGGSPVFLQCSPTLRSRTYDLCKLWESTEHNGNLETISIDRIFGYQTLWIFVCIIFNGQLEAARV